MTSQLAVEERDASKKSITRGLRKNGKIPAVLYGKTVENQPVTANEKDVIHILQEVGRNGVIQLNLNGKTFSVMTHDIQFDPIKREYVHLDFLEVDMSSKLDVEVPIHLTGEAIGIKQGAITQHHLNELTIRALPSDIPPAIELDVSEMDVGDVLKVKDVKKGSSHEILNDDDDVVVSIVPPAKDRGEADLDVKLKVEGLEENHEDLEG